MIVKLSDELFVDEALHRDLKYLITTINKREHIPVYRAGILDNIPDLDEKDRELFEYYESYMVVGDEKQPHCIVVKKAATIHNEKIFDIEEAIRYIGSPLYILVENSANDSPFLLTILSAYTKSRDAYEKGKLSFSNSGGWGNAEKYLREKLQQNNGRNKFLRYFVLLDSDKKYPDDLVIKKYDNLISFLKENNIGWHILEKRCMENYLPIKAFPQRESNEDWIKAFISMSLQQRDYMNIGGGFSKDASAVCVQSGENIEKQKLSDSKQQDFYSDVPPKNFQRLWYGYKLSSFKNDFPKGFNNGLVNRKTLDDIQNHQKEPYELQILAETIAEMI